MYKKSQIEFLWFYRMSSYTSTEWVLIPYSEGFLLGLLSRGRAGNLLLFDLTSVSPENPKTPIFLDKIGLYPFPGSFSVGSKF